MKSLEWNNVSAGKPEIKKTITKEDYEKFDV